MLVSPRKTRSRFRNLPSSREQEPADETVLPVRHVAKTGDGSPPCAESLMRLPSPLTSKQMGLSSSDLQTLLRKQQWLQKYTPSFSKEGDSFKTAPNLRSALDATLVFAQEEAGTAVCISPAGLILTCSHCVADNKAELIQSEISWLIFASGRVVQTRCIAWDPKRDLALCQIIASQEEPTGSSSSWDLAGVVFPSLPIAKLMPRKATPLMCIGHPGAEDLESVVPGVMTNYDTLYISQGKYRGYSPGQDVHDNEEIGALQHDCWTYWGHSGAPLIDMKTGCLIGLHSSWDDTTGMRRGIGLEAIQTFLRENLTSTNSNIPGLKELVEISSSDDSRQGQ